MQFIGICHVCAKETVIQPCQLCGHWFCSGCRNSPMARMIAFTKWHFLKKRPGCCGPSPRVQPVQ